VNASSEIGPGTNLAEGRYKVLGLIGEGSMGRVYRAHDRHLETHVVLKFPLPPGADLSGTDLLDRFAHEVRSLVSLGHPHIVRVIDAGDLGGNPFVVMQYLGGGTLRDRIVGHPRGMPPFTLRDWLPEIARALDFVHSQGFIHRDVKPANILFDTHGNPYLGDFGIIKALVSDKPTDERGNSLTAPGFLVGTPGYVAPEIVMGGCGDARSDQYSLALTIYEALTGRNVMAGPSPSATLVNQTTIEPPPLLEALPTVPTRLSEAVRRALSKEPEGRFPTCAAIAHEILADLPHEGVDAGVPSGADALATGAWGERKPATLRPTWKATPRVNRRALLGLTGAIALVGMAVVIMKFVPGRGGGGGQGESAGAKDSPAVPALADGTVTINIAYGTEKRHWLEAALVKFRETEPGRRIVVRLVPLGSVEGAQAILNGPGRTPIHVWSPASSAYRDAFERQWVTRHGGSPILEAKDLALTPMVFVMWRSRREAFERAYGAVTFRTIGKAMAEPRGWETIAERPDWGLSFHFGHTDPQRSNSGLLTLVLTAYEFASRQRGLTLADVDRPEFRSWLETFEGGVVGHGGALSPSTGTLMEEMVKRGPSQYDCLLVYENLAIDFMRPALDRWGDSGAIEVIYPDPNIWNENPYYVLDVPWSGEAERAAALEFLDFLTSQPIQRLALDFGFRPASPAVAVNVPASPLVRAAGSGVRIELPRMCEPPKAEVVASLLDFAAGLDRRAEDVPRR
jgi:hypothetical protein